MAWVERLTRWALAGLFLAAGLLKLWEPASFAGVIEAFGLLPRWAAPWAAILLPLAEIAAGLALLVRRRGGLEAITALLLLFIAVLSYGLFLGLDIDCGCYGPGDPQAEAFAGMRSSLYRDMGMLAGCGFLFWRGRAIKINI